MKIVLNSDILLSLKFAQGTLTDDLAELCHVCRERGIGIVVPETTLLEFERRHLEFAEKEVKGLAQALLLLDRFFIAHDDVDPRDVVKVPNLVELLEATGVAVEMTSPSFQDFQEAHRRACRHLPPSTDKKSDEMRDIVIWMVALGVARESGGALLLAKDALFHDQRVDEEARIAGLERLEAIEHVLDRIRGLRPAPERLAAILMVAIRDDLVRSGVDLPVDADLYRVSAPEFKLDDQGLLASAQFRLDVEGEGIEHFGASVEIELREGTIIGATILEAESVTLPLPSKVITLTTNRSIDLEAATAAAGLIGKAILGGTYESENR